MSDNPARCELKIWAAASTLIALASVYAFLQDLIAPDWRAWVLSPLVILGFRAAVSAAPADSVVRAALYQTALLLVPFMGVYGLADAAFSADWPAWVIAPSVVAMLWIGIAAISDVEAD